MNSMVLTMTCMKACFGWNHCSNRTPFGTAAIRYRWSVNGLRAVGERHGGGGRREGVDEEEEEQEEEEEEEEEEEVEEVEERRRKHIG